MLPMCCRVTVPALVRPCCAAQPFNFCNAHFLARAADKPRLFGGHGHVTVGRVCIFLAPLEPVLEMLRDVFTGPPGPGLM
jgi:hypothetical protein